jgi:Uma2 family endonuclease
MLDWDALPPERLRPLRREEYDHLVAAGVFADERIELLRGVLVTMSPQGDDHASVTDEVARLLYQHLGALGTLDRFTIRSHGPYAASDYSEPEPDVAVLPRTHPGDPHPTTAYLLVEVSDSSLRKDRNIKTGIYAEAGVPEYWIVDVQGGAVEVRTDPRDGAYQTMVRVERGETLHPIELPGVAIAVADILPAQGRTDTSA